jgi:hypothetical protein
MSARPKPRGPGRIDVDPEAFSSQPTAEELATAQGVRQAADPRDLKADFWPETETADDIVAAIRALRRGQQSSRNRLETLTADASIDCVDH